MSSRSVSAIRPADTTAHHQRASGDGGGSANHRYPSTPGSRSSVRRSRAGTEHGLTWALMRVPRFCDAWFQRWNQPRAAPVAQVASHTHTRPDDRSSACAGSVCDDPLSDQVRRVADSIFGTKRRQNLGTRIRPTSNRLGTSRGSPHGAP